MKYNFNEIKSCMTLYLNTFCVFRIWISEFVLTITSVPQQLQSPLTTHFKATYISFYMNNVSFSQSITMNKCEKYFGEPCRKTLVIEEFFLTTHEIERV